MTLDPATSRALRRAERRVREANEQRDELIREAVSLGGSLREVAELAGVSHQTVSNVVRRGNEGGKP